MKSKEDLTPQEDKIWKYMTRRKHENKGNAEVTVFHLSEQFDTTTEEMQEILESMAETGIVSIPPDWSMIHIATLKEERWVVEEGSITDEKPEKEPEIESPPPKETEIPDVEFEAIMQTLKERHEADINSRPKHSDRVRFSPEQTEDRRKRIYAAAKERAKYLISRYNLKSETKFRECQVCGAPDPELYIPDPEYPLLVNVLCHSHLMKEVNDSSGIQTISIRSEIEKKHDKTKAYSKNRIYENRLKNANSVKKAFRNRFNHLLPELHCVSCGVSENDKQINLRIVDPDNPYRVIPLCPECMQKYLNKDELSTFDIRDLGRINLVELIGIHVAPDLYYYEADILSAIRRGRKNLECYVCGIPLEESELYLDRIDENGFYLTCPDCMKTAKVDLLSGFGKSPTMVDLRGLDL